jgi:hypothetical protein
VVRMKQFRNVWLSSISKRLIMAMSMKSLMMK